MDAAYDGGGWTLVAVSSDDDQDTWTWDNRHYWDTDTTTFGALSALNYDFKSTAFHEAAAEELLFVHQPSDVWAAYSNISQPPAPLATTLTTIAGPVLYDGTDGWLMTAGTVTATGSLCSTQLFLNPMDYDVTRSSNPLQDHTYGPAWSLNNGNGCPLDDPGSESSLGPHGNEGPSEPVFSVEQGAVGFGNALSLNTGVAGNAENYMQVYVRTLADCLSTTTAQGMDFVRLCGGTFEMGCTAAQQADGNCGGHEFPAHSVTLTNDFWMSETEVTQGQWSSVLPGSPNPSSFSSCPEDSTGATCPVEEVNWYEVLEFANAVSSAQGLAECYTVNGSSVSINSSSGSVYDCTGYRLPTEAEWEYAARAGTDLLYAGSNTVDDVAWYSGNSGDTTHAVATKAPNAWGLHDMSGNVWEWTWDRHGSYSSSPSADPEGPSTGSVRVARGGGWYYGASYARVAHRGDFGPDDRYYGLGFRLSRTVP